ncbi:MAG TPA: hypothetical protein VHO69_04310 [Phototrophicaceae bacterium]|nr:hypothetical protein [Phototrophicaceae bacterium]
MSKRTNQPNLEFVVTYPVTNCAERLELLDSPRLGGLWGTQLRACPGTNGEVKLTGVRRQLTGRQRRSSAWGRSSYEYAYSGFIELRLRGTLMPLDKFNSTVVSLYVWPNLMSFVVDFVMFKLWLLMLVGYLILGPHPVVSPLLFLAVGSGLFLLQIVEGVAAGRRYARYWMQEINNLLRYQ